MNETAADSVIKQHLNFRFDLVLRMRRMAGISSRSLASCRKDEFLDVKSQHL